MKNAGLIINKGGVQVDKLLDSSVFRYSFDFDNWISNHTNDEEYLRAYNGSIFEIRNAYTEVFPEEDLFGPIDEDTGSNKIFKISFHVNLLPTLCHHWTKHPQTGKSYWVEQEYNFLEVCTESEEIDIFDQASVHELIDFKWENLAENF